MSLSATKKIVVSRKPSTDDIYLCHDTNHKSFKLIREVVFIESEEVLNLYACFAYFYKVGINNQ
jgi:hypothetical protein